MPGDAWILQYKPGFASGQLERRELPAAFLSAPSVSHKFLQESVSDLLEGHSNSCKCPHRSLKACVLKKDKEPGGPGKCKSHSQPFANVSQVHD